MFLSINKDFSKKYFLQGHLSSKNLSFTLRVLAFSTYLPTKLHNGELIVAASAIRKIFGFKEKSRNNYILTKKETALIEKWREACFRVESIYSPYLLPTQTLFKQIDLGYVKKYNKERIGTLKIKFRDDVANFLRTEENNFVKVSLEQLEKLNSKDSKILFILMCQMRGSKRIRMNLRTLEQHLYISNKSGQTEAKFVSELKSKYLYRICEEITLNTVFSAVKKDISIKKDVKGNYIVSISFTEKPGYLNPKDSKGDYDVKTVRDHLGFRHSILASNLHNFNYAENEISYNDKGNKQVDVVLNKKEQNSMQDVNNSLEKTTNFKFNDPEHSVNLSADEILNASPDVLNIYLQDDSELKKITKTDFSSNVWLRFIYKLGCNTFNSDEYSHFYTFLFNLDQKLASNVSAEKIKFTSEFFGYSGSNEDLNKLKVFIDKLRKLKILLNPIYKNTSVLQIKFVFAGLSINDRGCISANFAEVFKNEDYQDLLFRIVRALLCSFTRKDLKSLSCLKTVEEQIVYTYLYRIWNRKYHFIDKKGLLIQGELASWKIEDLERYIRNNSYFNVEYKVNSKGNIVIYDIVHKGNEAKFKALLKGNLDNFEVIDERYGYLKDGDLSFKVDFYGKNTQVPKKYREVFEAMQDKFFGNDCDGFLGFAITNYD